MIFVNVYLNDKYYLSSKGDIFAKYMDVKNGEYTIVSCQMLLFCFQQKIRKIKIMKLSILNGTCGVYYAVLSD